MQKKHLTKSNTHSSLKLSKLGIEGNFLNLLKSIYKKPTGHILNNEKLHAFLPKMRNKVRMSPLTTPVKHCTEREKQKQNLVSCTQ